MAAHDHQGGFARPSDVPEYVPQPISFATGTNLNVPGTGIAPGVANQLPAIEVPEEGLVLTGDYTQPTAPPAHQAKFRLTLGPASHILFDDPIRNFGHPGASHLHQFFGNEATNAFSDFASLRTRNSSRSFGKAMNATGYWMPSPVEDNPAYGGKLYAPQMNNGILYYDDDRILETTRLTRIPRGMRYVFGMNMDNPLETHIREQLAAANAGAPGRYSIEGDRGPNNPPQRFIGWAMLDPDAGRILTSPSADRPNSKYSDGFKNADGTDPWLGAADPDKWGGRRCSLFATFDGPRFWDRVNPWSPGGYDHFHYGFYDNVEGKLVGPQGWQEVPRLQGQLAFYHGGWDQYRYWSLSSDPIIEAKLGRAIPPGSSWHADWLGAWQDRVFLGWQTFCTGVGNSNPHECNNATFSHTETLVPFDRYPHYDNSTPTSMFLIPSSGTGKGPLVLKSKVA